MPRNCTVCERGDVAAINGALAGGGAVREVARLFSVGRDALARHAQSHIAPEGMSQNVTPAPEKTTPEPALEAVLGGSAPGDSVTSEPGRAPVSMPTARLVWAPVQEDTAPVDAQREAIVRYIQERLGPDLGELYADAIRSSVSTGCYDYEWNRGAPYLAIERYLSILHKDWISHQGDTTALISRLFFLQMFGTPEQRAMLAELDLVTAAVVAGNG